MSMLDSGQKIGPYTIHECAGEGGMARVYKVWHDGLHRFEALKTPRGSTSADSAYVTRLLAEARVAARLHHPNIVGIHSVSEPSADLPFFTMDWVEGRDLAKVMAERGPFSLEETIEILSPVAAALDYAHDYGVVHRDVKPANILLGEVRGGIVPKVVDFGISRAAEDEEGATKLTKSGMLVGTPEYMSPEQSGSGAAVNYHTDIYSLGVVAFEMLCGRPPFTAGEGVSRLSILVSHVRDAAPLWDHVPHFPRYSGEVLMRALSKSPEKRYPDCTTFLAELKKAAELDGPFTAFVYDENGQRTPFDASRFAPADAATLMERPGAITPDSHQPATPETRPLHEGAATRVDAPADFPSLGARLAAPEAKSNDAPASEELTPSAKILTRELGANDEAVANGKASATQSVGSAATSEPPPPPPLKVTPVRDSAAARPARSPLPIALGLLGILAIAGVTWFVSHRASDAVKNIVTGGSTPVLTATPEADIDKSPLVQSAQTRPTPQIKTVPYTTPIPYPTKIAYSAKYPFNTKRVTQRGQNGEKVQKWKVTYRGGKLVSQEPLSIPVVTQTATPEITTLGTRRSSLSAPPRRTFKTRVFKAPVAPRLRPKPVKKLTGPKARPQGGRKSKQRGHGIYVPLPG